MQFRPLGKIGDGQPLVGGMSDACVLVISQSSQKTEFVWPTNAERPVEEGD